MSVILLAFGFATPALLGWLALAATPLLIHWLFRRRFREVPWAAMQFLYEAARKQSRRSRLEQLLLLATRMLILIVVVLALARPHFADQDLLARPSPPTLRLLVIDCSLSMGRLVVSSDEVSAANPLEAPAANRSRRTLFDSAKQTVKEIVQRGQAGDRCLLVRVSGSEPRVLIRQPTANVNSVLEEIDRTKLTFERGDVAATLRLLPELISRKRPDERCELVVISDFQSDNWSGVLSDQTNVGANAELAALWKQLSEEQSLSLREVGPSAADNATIASLRTDSPLLAAGQATSVTSLANTIVNTATLQSCRRRISLEFLRCIVGKNFIVTKRCYILNIGATINLL